MADDCLQRLEEAMARVWFHQNILLPSSTHLSLRTTAESGTSPPLPPPPPPPPPPPSSVTAAEDKSDGKARHHSYRKKRPARLDIITSDKLFQMPPSPFTSSRRRPSSQQSSVENSPQPRRTSRRRPTRMMRSYKSLSELEQDELKGFMDLGFVFHKEALSARMMSVLPGLQRLGKKPDEQPQGGEDATAKERVRRPYLAEAWLINRPDSPLLNLKMPASSTEGADMKRQLRFWARTVASTIYPER